MKTCFIIMPFSKATSDGIELTSEDLNYIYTDIIKKAVDEFIVDDKKYFIEVLRFDEKVGSISKGIVQKLKDADLVVADLTGLNPNVMYELGVRHSLKRGTIMLTQNIHDFPSDLRDYLTVIYEYKKGDVIAQKKVYETFKAELHKNIVQILETDKTDSPVLEYVENINYYRNETEIAQLKKNAIIVDAMLEDYYELVSLVWLDENAISETRKNNKIRKELIGFFLTNIYSKFGKLEFPRSSSIMYHDFMSAENLLIGLSTLFTLNDTIAENELLKTVLVDIATSTDYDLEALLDKKIIDPFKLKWERKIQYISIREVFKEEDGLLETEFLEDLIEFVELEAKRLGVENEIDEILKK